MSYNRNHVARDQRPAHLLRDQARERVGRGIILGPLSEQYLLRVLCISQGDFTILFSSPPGNALWGLLVLSLVLPF